MYFLKLRRLLSSFCIIFSILFIVSAGYSQTGTGIYEKIKSFPGVKVKKVKPTDHFKETYQIYLDQPLDHTNPGGEKFSQKIYLSHFDKNRPVVLETEGYSAFRYKAKELTKLLDANQIVVEHRFFGKSVPDSMDWKYLTIKQAAGDYHRIVSLFKEIYNGKWVNTGTSKGGQTALTHRWFYPDDVTATVAYVAPLNLALEDPRIYSFLNTVGTKKCRDRIEQFQKLVLINIDHILPLLKNYAEKRRMKFPLSLDAVIEYSVAEYPFSFWQYGKSECDSIPMEGDSYKKIFKHLLDVSGVYLYSDNGIKYFLPSFYQNCTEFGFYGFDVSHLKGLLKSGHKLTNTFFAPQNTDLTYKPEIMAELNQYLNNHGNNIIYIYGELDTWSATAVQLTGKTNAVKVIQKGGFHNAKIRKLSEEKRKKVHSALEDWLDLKIKLQ